MVDREWSEVDPLLGTATDEDLAREFGVSISVIGNRRRKLGIPCKRKALKCKYDWGSVRSRLGIDADADIARDLGCTRAAVHLMRKRLGIMSCTQHRGDVFDWSVVDWGYSDNTIRHKYRGIGSLGEIARKRVSMGEPHLRRHVIVRAKRYSFDYERFRSLVGTMSDRALSKVIGLSVQRIGDLRRELGIGVYGGRVTRRIDWLGWDEVIRGWGGTMVDLARKIGCSVASLGNRRKKLGLAGRR